jgi:hypothetical protein
MARCWAAKQLYYLKDYMRLSRDILRLTLAVTITCGATAVHAQDRAPTFVAKETGIYRVDAKGQRSLILKPKSDEVFAATTFTVSPNHAWALIDHLPLNPGAGRVEEVRVLISLKDGTRIEQDAFKRKYGEWLGELADWAPDAPATIELENGKKIRLR